MKCSQKLSLELRETLKERVVMQVMFERVAVGEKSKKFWHSVLKGVAAVDSDWDEDD